VAQGASGKFRHSPHESRPVSLPGHAVSRPACVDPPHQFFSELDGFIKSSLTSAFIELIRHYRSTLKLFSQISTLGCVEADDSMRILTSTYQGFLITVVLLASVVVPSVAQNQSNPKVPQSQGWSYEQFTDKLTERTLVTAGLESVEGMHIAVEQHPRFSSSAYIFFLLESGKAFDCEQSCVINIRFDDGKLEPWPVQGPTNTPSVGLPLAQFEELITRLRNSHHFIIEAPVLSAGRVSFDFYSEGIVWPPPPSAVSVRAEGTPLAERNGLHAGGKDRFGPMPSCFYTPNPPITKGRITSDFQGTVEAEAKVTVEGTIENIKILKSPSPALNESVIETSRTWKCKPATLPGGEPIPTVVIFEIDLKRQ
jgi:TonB family protein